MTKRERIQKKIQRQRDIITQSNHKIFELTKEDWLLCDKKQWFTEKEETFLRGNKKSTHLVGRINWMEDFYDECHPNKPIWIERSRIVRVDGEFWDYPFEK